MMREYRRQHKRDVQISLADLGSQNGERGFDIRAPRKEDEDLCVAVLTFTHDVAHRMVHRNYWENELARALNYAGIAYERRRLWVSKPYLERLDWAIGDNCAVVGFRERHEETELLTRINAHTVNMRVNGVAWHDHLPKLRSIRYRIPYQALIGEKSLRLAASKVLEQSEWIVDTEERLANRSHTFTRDVRPLLRSLTVDERFLHMEVDPRLAPYTVLCNVANMSWNEAGSQIAVREGMCFE